MSDVIGNRLTDNALAADDAADLVARARREIEDAYGWKPSDPDAVFTGYYYDPRKIGSRIVRVADAAGKTAVLKLQLRPLRFDEGFIIRQVAPQIRTPRVRLPRILRDEPWSEARGYGFLLFEDLTALPDLWHARRPDGADLARHRDFLAAFARGALPIAAWFPPPSDGAREQALAAFAHFRAIADASPHRRLSAGETSRLRDAWIARLPPNAAPPHFTHGHLSGLDVKVDAASDAYVLFANLTWSYRPPFYEVVFPWWADAMGIRDPRVTADDLRRRADAWADIGAAAFGRDPRADPAFRFALLTRAALTVLLDLGASDWPPEEADARGALWQAWKDFFRQETGSGLGR